MKKRGITITALFIVLAVLYSVNLQAGGVVSSSLPLRFSEKKVLDGVSVGKVDTTLVAGPVTLSGGNVVGSPGALPADSAVAILWQGIEVGRGKVASDGSFSIPVPNTLSGAVSLLYAPSLPNLEPGLNVGAMVQGYTKGTASAASYYPGSPGERAFNFNLNDMWNFGGMGPAWVLRDLGRELEISEVRIWFAGWGVQNRWARVSVSIDGTTFTPIGEKWFMPQRRKT